MRHDATKYYITRLAMTKYLIVSAFPCEVFLLRLTFQYARVHSDLLALWTDFRVQL